MFRWLWNRIKDLFNKVISTMLRPLVQAIELWFNSLIAHQILPVLGLVIEYAVIAIMITPLFLINYITDAIDIFAGVKPIFEVDRLDAAKLEAAYDSSPHYLLWSDDYERTPPYPRPAVSPNIPSGMSVPGYNSYTSPVRNVWRDFIQKNESIVMRASKKYNDHNRYMPYIREFLRENNIAPDSEDMYRALSNALTMGVAVGSGVRASDIPMPPGVHPVDAYNSVMMPKSLDVPYFEYTNPRSDTGLYIMLEAFVREGHYTPVFEMKSSGEKMSRSDKKKFKELNNKNLPVYKDIFEQTVLKGMAYPQYLSERLRYLRDNPSPGNNAELSRLLNTTYAQRADIGEFMDESAYSYVNSDAATEKAYVEIWNKRFPGMQIDKNSPEWKKTLPFFYYWPLDGKLPKHWPPIEIQPKDEWFNDAEQQDIRNEYTKFYNKRYTDWYGYFYDSYLKEELAHAAECESCTEETARSEAARRADNSSKNAARNDADNWLNGKYNEYIAKLETDRKNMPSWAGMHDFFMSYTASMNDDDLLYGDYTGSAESRTNITIACFFPANELWIDYIQNNADIVADWNRAYNDTNRYTKVIRDLMSARRLTPGSYAFYETIAGQILSYQLDIGDTPVNKWLPADLGYTPYIGEPEEFTTIDYIDTGLRGTLLDYFITNPTVNTVFWGITAISMALCIGFSIYAVVRSMGDMKVEKPVGKVLGMVGKSFLTFLIIPFFVLAVLNLASLVLNRTTYAFNSRSGGSDRATVSGALFVSTLVPEAVKLPGETSLMDSFTVNKDRKIILQEFRKTGAAADQQRQQRYEQMIDKYIGERIGYTHLPEMRKDFELMLLIYPGSMILISICAWIFVQFLILIVFVFIRRVFDIVMLYIISPLYTATIPLDDGLVFKRWREKFIGACVSGFGSLITFQLFLLVIPLIWERGFQLTDNVMTDNVLKALIMIGGVYAVHKSHTIVTSLVSAEAAQNDMGTAKAVAGAIKTATDTVAAGVKMVGQMAMKEATGSDGSEMEGAAGGMDGGGKDTGMGGDKDKDKDNKDGDSGSGNKNPNMGGDKDKDDSSGGVAKGNKDDSTGKGDKDDSSVTKSKDDESGKHKPPDREPPKVPGMDSSKQPESNVQDIAPINSGGGGDGGGGDGGDDDDGDDED